MYNLYNIYNEISTGPLYYYYCWDDDTDCSDGADCDGLCYDYWLNLICIIVAMISTAWCSLIGLWDYATKLSRTPVLQLSTPWPLLPSIGWRHGPLASSGSARTPRTLAAGVSLALPSGSMMRGPRGKVWGLSRLTSAY